MPILEPLLPQIWPVRKQTRPCDWTKRELLDGMFYQLKNGCNWQDLPCISAALLNRLSALQAVAGCRSNSCTDDRLTWTSASTSQKKAKWTTLRVIDSQAVKNTCNASVESKGFCFYKCTNGIKRHLAVDTRLLSVFYPLHQSQCLR